MILLVLMGLLNNILARNHPYEDYNNLNLKQSSNDHDYLLNNNLSEDEINAINGYKRSENSHQSIRNNIFDSRWFDNRRIISWISNMLYSETTPSYEDIVEDKKFYLHLTRNLTENLAKLTSILEMFTKELRKKSVINRSLRSARSITGNETLKTEDNLNKSVNFDENRHANIDRTHQVQVVTEAVIETANNNASRRRSFNFRQLISSINDTLNVIKYEISSVSNIKEIFDDKLSYNVGFISGSLTAINSMVEEVQRSLLNNKVVLDVQYVLHLYDSVNQIKEGSERMLEKLRAYVERAVTYYNKN